MKTEEKVLFKPMETKSIGLKVDDREEMLDELTKRLAKLGIGDDPKKKSLIPLIVESEEEESLKIGDDQYLTQIESMLKASKTNEVNRITYPRPQATT